MKQRRFSSARAGIAPLALLLAAFELATAQAQDRATLFVLDVSRSMKSTVDGKSKITHAKEVLSEVSQGPRRALGLVTFGARDASSCTDVAVAAPLGGDPSAFRSALDAAEPTGVAPIGEAVRVAFEAAQKGGKPTTLVLIADGPDTCNANLCAAARSMKEQAPSLQVHAIGFVSSEPRKVEALACLAEATGGRFTIARGRAGLAQAVADAVGGASAIPADQIAAKPSDMTPLSVAAKPESAASVQASAFQAPRADPSPAVLARSSAAATDVPREVPVPAWAPRPVLSLAPTGLNAFAAARPRTDAATAHGKPRPPNDGLPKVPVSLAAALADQLPMLKEGVLWRVFSAVKDGSGAHPLVTESAQSAPMLTLAPGDYIVHCAYGRAQATKQIRVGGGPAYHRLVLDAGALRLSAMVGQTGSVSPDLVSFAIYRGDPETTRENMLVVPAARPGRIIRLGEGTYHVVSRYGDGNALVRANVRVEAGRLTDATIHHKAARITLKLVGEPGGEAIANTSWSVKTKAGETVQESIGAFPSHVLAAGDYTVIARHDARTFQRDFKVEPGPDREVEVLAR